jgi:hypothetical protein
MLQVVILNEVSQHWSFTARGELALFDALLQLPLVGRVTGVTHVRHVHDVHRVTSGNESYRDGSDVHRVMVPSDAHLQNLRALARSSRCRCTPNLTQTERHSQGCWGFLVQTLFVSVS